MAVGEFGSLFSGIGGLDVGLERAGWRCAWMCESDKDARAVLAERFPDVHCFDDVRGIAEEVRREEVPEIELLAGGFP